MEMRKTIAQSKSQLHADSSSNTLPGYKWTEGRIIPEDWKIKSLGELCSYQNGTSLERYFNNQEGYIVISIGNYSTEGNFVETGNYIDRIHSKTLNKFILNKNDLTMILNDKTSVGAIIGRVLLIEADNKYIFNQRTMRLTPKNQILPSFLYYQINCKRTHQDIVNKAKPGTQIYINTDDVIGLNVSLPASKHEQRAIAKALSDIDKLIEALEKLIAKKRAIKQAAMQQLLTGQTRLPGFQGEWEMKTLGDLFSFSGGYSASRDQLSTEGQCYLHYGDIHGSTKTSVDARTDYQDIPKLDVPLKRVSSGSLLKDGDVVFVDASEDDEGTSRHVVVVNKDNVPFISGLHTIVAKSKTDELVHEYRQYCFQTAAIREQFLFYAVGTKVSGISKTNIPKLKLPLPSAPEQTAIAALLTDMDAELAALTQRLAKTRALKQGMMQELLTGRTRLVFAEVAA